MIPAGPRWIDTLRFMKQDPVFSECDRDGFDGKHLFEYHDLACTCGDGCQQLRARMSGPPHALQTGSAAGFSFALVARAIQAISEPLPPVPPDFFCPDPTWSDLHWFSLALGILIGFCLGPVIEAATAFRALIYQATLQRCSLVWGVPNRSYYKLC